MNIITPDSKINKTIKNKTLDEVDLIIYEVANEGILLDPRLPADCKWIATQNISSPKGRIDFIFLNGIVYTNSKDVEYANFRIMRFPDLFTIDIESNTYTIRFQMKTTIFLTALGQKEAISVTDDIEIQYIVK